MGRKLCTCPRLSEARILQHDFVLQVYDRPEDRILHCARCRRIGAKSLAIAILSTLCKPSETRSFSELIRLRAAFWSITGNMHGKKQSTEFNIKNIEETSSGVRCTVLTEHDQLQEFTLFKEEFIEMVLDPVPGIRGTI